MAGPTPERFFETVAAYQQTEALRAALELDLFSALASGPAAAALIAARCGASERGTRILCDFLTIRGFLSKAGEHYTLTAESAAFLVRGSPTYLGGCLDFLLAADLMRGFADLAGCVRQGGTTVSARGTMEAQHPVWVKFARSMGPLIGAPARYLAELADPGADHPLSVLDLAAGHGLFGIAFAQRNAQAQITAQDWAPVLAVAMEHAQTLGVATRYRLLPGDAFEVDLGHGHDVVLLTNFLHHFDADTGEGLLRRVAACLKPGGLALTLEFVPGPDRVTPPPAATFALTMLATTAAGDAYTFAEYEAMHQRAGFSRCALHALPHSPQSAILARR